MQSTEQGKMAISLSILSAACFIGAAISLLRYDGKCLDLLDLSGVIFIGTAMPSFEVDASFEELKSINHNLANIQTAVEDLQRNRHYRSNGVIGFGAPPANSMRLFVSPGFVFSVAETTIVTRD
jgi:hypothetical protein